MQRGLTKLSDLAESFESTSTSSLLRSAPDLSPHLDHIRSLFTYNKETDDVLPADGVDEAYEEVQQEIDRLEAQLEDIRRDHAKELGCREISYWHSAQGQKEIYQIQVPVKIKVPKSWTKTGGVKAFNRWASPETAPVIRELQEARETRTQVARAFIRRLLAEFDSDRDTWLLAVKIVGELDCLGSLAVASQELDEPCVAAPLCLALGQRSPRARSSRLTPPRRRFCPFPHRKCRPAFIESDHAQVKFESLRHPAMCLRSDFIPNDVAMGGDQAKMVLLTGPCVLGSARLSRARTRSLADHLYPVSRSLQEHGRKIDAAPDDGRGRHHGAAGHVRARRLGHVSALHLHRRRGSARESLGLTELPPPLPIPRQHLARRRHQHPHGRLRPAVRARLDVQGRARRVRQDPR